MMVENCKYGFLSQMFGISRASVSKILTQVLPILVDHFIQYIPNKMLSEYSSNMCKLIAGVIDGTAIHINRRYPQNIYYRKDKTKGHFVQLMLLVDFEDKIFYF